MKSYVLIALFAVFALQTITAQTVATFSDLDPDDAIAFDSDGNIYAAGFIEGEIYKFTPQGVASTFVTGLNNANGIDFDSTNNLYANDWNANEILRYFADGNLDTVITIPGNPSGMLKAIDNDDMIYTRYGGNTINRITPDGIITQISDGDDLNGPVGLAYDENGNLYVGNYNDRKVFRVGTDGTLTYVATVGGSSNLGFIAFAKGRLWGTVLGEHKIYTINHNGIDDVTLFAGSTMGSQDGDLSQATFNRPNGIRFDLAENTLYVTDFGTKNLRVISDITLGIASESLTPSAIVLYPNPSSDSLHIKGISNEATTTLTLTSAEGKLLKTSEVQANSGRFEATIDVTCVAAGTYFITIADNTNSVTKQWIKK